MILAEFSSLKTMLKSTVYWFDARRLSGILFPFYIKTEYLLTFVDYKQTICAILGHIICYMNSPNPTSISFKP